MERVINTSWFIDGNTAIKLCDNTAFKESNTVIPIKHIKGFFCDKDLDHGETITINIKFGDEICKFRIVKDSEGSSTTMFWKNTKVEDHFKSIKNPSIYNYKGLKGDINTNDYTLMCFIKDTESNTIELKIMNENIQKENKEEYIFRKSVDLSVYKYGVTIPKNYLEKFLSYTTSKKLDKGTSQNIKLMFDDYEAECRLNNVNIKDRPGDTIQIRYDSNKELKDYLADKFRYTKGKLGEGEKIEGVEYMEFYPTNKENEYYVKLKMFKNQPEVSSIISNIQNYIQNQGYTYSLNDISNLYLSLKTKPFVILAGISGTGKSKIVRLFSEAIGATTNNNRFNMISVRPDWNDSTDLIGYKNLKDEFVEGSLTKIIKMANENKGKPYFICLDEMNLARVEYYLSDYLSIIESRKKIGDEISTDKIINDLHIPHNLYVIGTVNMDDSTFQFSRKVLDRANTIEFSDVDLSNLFGEVDDEEIDSITLDNNFFKTAYLKTADIEEEYRDYAKIANEKIINLNNILKKSQKQFAYRVRDEILFYMIENKKTNLLSEDVAFDYQIMQKILPVISGSEGSVREVLIDLFNFVCDSNINSDMDYIEKAESYLRDSDNIKYEKSANKILYMLKGYTNDGYVSYWY